MLCECHVHSGLSISADSSFRGDRSFWPFPSPPVILPLSASWHAGRSVCRRHSRQSCSRSRHTFWPAPPSGNYHACPDSFCLQTGRRRRWLVWMQEKKRKKTQLKRHNCMNYAHSPATCGPQGMVLHICSCSGLVLGSHAMLCFLSAVRHRTSLTCKPFPHEREHWEQTQHRIRQEQIVLE